MRPAAVTDNSIVGNRDQMRGIQCMQRAERSKIGDRVGTLPVGLNKSIICLYVDALPNAIL